MFGSFDRQRGRLGVGFGLVLLVVVIIISSKFTESRRAADESAAIKQQYERAAAAKNAAGVYFSEHRDLVLGEILAGIEKKDYRAALQVAAKYAHVDDAELRGLKNTALEMDVYVKAKKIPAEDAQANKDAYARLMELNPSSDLYRQKHQHYAAVVAAEYKVQRDRLARFGSPPVRNVFGAGYDVIDRHLKRAMHDPGSLDMEYCTSVSYTESGWLIGCRYRGKNAFGALVLESKWFTVRNGLVLKIDDQGAYRW